jgi:excisionase family DNA binding protein
MTHAARDDGDLLSVSAAAGLLGVSVSSLRAWAAAGQVPHERTPGGHRRFDREVLRAWLAARGGELPQQPSGRGHALVAGRIEARPVAAGVISANSRQIVSDALALMADGGHPSHRRTHARSDRLAEQVCDLADALEAGDLSVCLREAEWQAHRHGAAGLPATQPVGEALALGRAVERTLRDHGCGERDITVARSALDRIIWRAAAGLAAGRRSREQAHDGLVMGHAA